MLSGMRQPTFRPARAKLTWLALGYTETKNGKAQKRGKEGKGEREKVSKRS